MVMNTVKEPEQTTNQSPITITERDKRYLEKMIFEIKLRGRKEENLDALAAELNRAEIVASEAVSPDVVTMGSLFSMFDMETLERFQYRLVFPEQTEEEDYNISILSPIGTGVLGYKTGDEVTWKVPAGIRRFRIAKVDYQPDAANTYRI